MFSEHTQHLCFLPYVIMACFFPSFKFHHSIPFQYSQCIFLPSVKRLFSYMHFNVFFIDLYFNYYADFLSVCVLAVQRSLIVRLEL